MEHRFYKAEIQISSFNEEDIKKKIKRIEYRLKAMGLKSEVTDKAFIGNMYGVTRYSCKVKGYMIKEE